MLVTMDRGDHQRPTSADLACGCCGRLPHPHRGRLTLAKLVAVFPIEFLLHALVIYQELSFVATVAVLTVSTTILVMWVVEPSALRILRRWLHAPALRHQQRISSAPTLWRLRVTLDDRPGALDRLTGQLAACGADILSLHVHPLDKGVRDELVVAAPEHVRPSDLVAAAHAGKAAEVHIWPTTALALVDGATKALSLAARVSENPSELPLAAAELVGAVVTDQTDVVPGRRHGPYETELRLPTPAAGVVVLSRPDEPFTPAESARANRLAEIAEIAEIGRRSAMRGR